jgi:hypothetical protein
MIHHHVNVSGNVMPIILRTDRRIGSLLPRIRRFDFSRFATPKLGRVLYTIGDASQENSLEGKQEITGATR